MPQDWVNVLAGLHSDILLAARIISVLGEARRSCSVARMYYKSHASGRRDSHGFETHGGWPGALGVDGVTRTFEPRTVEGSGVL